MTDAELVARLRELTVNAVVLDVAQQAADRIERGERRIAELEMLLSSALGHFDRGLPGWIERARAALSAGKGEGNG